jgi:alpha-D-ribose 1-methylphosphonate 5-triphosphate synthase subunit PhnI
LFKKLKEVGWNVNDVNVSEVNIVNEFKGSDGARNKRGKQFAVRAGRVY